MQSKATIPLDLARASASPGIAVCAGTAALVRIPSAILLAVREQWHSVRSLLVLNAAAQAAAQWTTTPNAHRQGDNGRVRPPMPMRQPCARVRTSRSLPGAPACVTLRRRAVRSLVQHAARVQGGRWAMTTPWGTAECTRSPRRDSQWIAAAYAAARHCSARKA